MNNASHRTVDKLLIYYWREMKHQQVTGKCVSSAEIEGRTFRVRRVFNLMYFFYSTISGTHLFSFYQTLSIIPIVHIDKFTINLPLH